MKLIFNRNWLLALFAVGFTPSLVHAHTDVGHTGRFMYGLGHPISGIDHILAMAAVGIWAFQTGSRGVWAVPIAFVSVMSIGSVLGIMGVTIPFIEQGIALSVLLLGIFITIALRLPLKASAMIAGIFALFHGHAHGTEMANGLSGLSYMAGFVLSTSLLHLSGISISVMLNKFNMVQMVRYAGAVIAGAGIYLIF